MLSHGVALSALDEVGLLSYECGVSCTILSGLGITRRIGM